MRKGRHTWLEHRSSWSLDLAQLCCLPAANKDNVKGDVYIVYDYAEYDLTGLMDSMNRKMSESHRP